MTQVELDPWQKEVIETKGDVCLVSGRQVGKSTILSMDAAEWAVKHPNKTVLMIASVERQAYGLFEKTLTYLMDNYRHMIKKGRNNTTKSKCQLINGTTILCLPTGLDGHGIRFLTVHRLYGDEAHYIPLAVWTAVTPMLAMTGGDQRLSSTPNGPEGYFRDCCEDKKNFKTFHVNTREVTLARKFCKTWTKEQRDKSLAHIDREEKRMTKHQFAQEYMGEFIDNFQRVFSDEVIAECCTLKRRGGIMLHRQYFLGVDVARLGEDKSTFEIVDRTRKQHIEHIENLETEKTRTTATTDMIVELDNKYNFKKIYVDGAGVGGGVVDQLLTINSTKRKVQDINNAKRSLTHGDKPERRKTLKDDLYNNLLSLMEKGGIRLLDDDNLIHSLQSMLFEYSDDGKRKIWSKEKDSHITEGLIRAAYCHQDKSLNIWIQYS